MFLKTIPPGRADLGTTDDLPQLQLAPKQPDAMRPCSRCVAGQAGTARLVKLNVPLPVGERADREHRHRDAVVRQRAAQDRRESWRPEI
jgi:hypothetical protein